MAPAAAELTTRLVMDIALIELSGLNPRTHFDQHDDIDLVASIKKDGIIEPLVLRPHPKKDGRFQIVAGERRYKAARAVGLDDVPYVIRDVDDAKLLDLALQENIQRRSMHPLDEANGFIKRLEMGKTDPEQLAASLGLTPRYVKDRIRLKKLTPKAAKLLETGEMPIGFAIVLAKLDPKIQDDALKECTHYEFDFDSDKSRPTLQSVSELKEWIADNVRLDVHSPEVQAEFPEVAQEVAAAAEKGATVVALSEERTPYQHKAKKDDPLFADRWERCKKTDKGAQSGIIVEGRNRGARVYFRPPAPPKRATSSSGGPQGSGVQESAAAKTKRLAREKRDAAARERERERQAQWKKASKDAQAAIDAHIDATPINKLVAGVARAHYSPTVKKATTADGLIRALASHEATLGNYSLQGLASHAKPFGFDVKTWFANRLKQNKAIHKLHPPKKAKKR